MRPHRKAEWSLLFAAACLPAPHPAAVESFAKPLPLVNGAWEQVGQLGALKFTTEQPHGTVLEADTGPAERRSTTRYDFATGAIRGFYRTEGVYPFATVVTASFYKGERWLGDRDFYLDPSVTWRAFELPVRFAPPGADGVRVGVGLAQAGVGKAFFTDLLFSKNGGVPLIECGPRPPITRPLAPTGLEASGYIRLRLTDTGWWFVSPTGRGVFSIGLGRTMTENPGLNPGLPAKLVAWGFNSLADSSNYAAWYQLGLVDPTNVPWIFHVQSNLPTDPYDPNFADNFRRQVRLTAQYLRGVPWVAGSYADDELRVDAFEKAIWSPGASQALSHFLLVKYGNIEILNQAWGTTFASFDELVKKRPRPKASQPAIARDLAAFTRELVTRYVAITTRILREEDPEHLLFSPRIRIGPDLLGALPYLDLFAAYDAIGVKLSPESLYEGLSVNEVGALELIARVTQRPLIVSELSVSARDSGLYDDSSSLDRSFWTSVDTQGARAQQAAHVLVDLYNLPYVAGVHWESLRDIDDGARKANVGLLKATGALEYLDLQNALTSIATRIWAPEQKITQVAAAPPKPVPTPTPRLPAKPADIPFVISSGVSK